MIYLILFFVVIFFQIIYIHFKIERFSPLIFPILFWLFYELPKVEYFLNNPISLTNIQYYFWLTLGALFYFLGINYRFFQKKKIFTKIIKFRTIKQFEKIALYSFILSCFIFLYLFIVEANYNFLYFFTRRLGNYEAQEFVSANYFLVILINVSILLNSISFKFNFTFYKLSKLIILFIIIFVFTGSRSYILLPILFLIFTSLPKLNFRYYIPLFSLVVILFFSFSFLGSLRTFDDFRDISLKSIFDKSEQFSINDYQLQFRDEAALKFYKDRPLMYGSSYFVIFTSFIPRKILGSYKPKMLDGKIASEVFRNFNAGYPIHPITEARLNFGVFGLLVLFLIGYVYSNLIFGSHDLISKYIFSYLMIFSQTLYSTYLMYSFQFFILIIFISFFIRIKFSK